MAGVKIEIRSRELSRALLETERRARNMTPAWNLVGEHMLGSVRENFDQGGRPKWTPLKTATLLARVGGKKKATKKRGGLTAGAKKKMAGAKPLIDSTRLMNSMTYLAGGRGVVIGTSVEYAATHQFGRTSGRGAPIPARPFLVIQPEDEGAIASILERYLAGPLQ